jgi:glutamine synthetase
VADPVSGLVLSPDELAGAGIRTVAVCTPDLVGRLLGRRLSVPSFLRAVERGVDMCTAGFVWDIEQQPVVEGITWAGFHTGWHDVTLRPDLATLRPAGWVDGVAYCLADACESADGSPVRVSPRAVLRGQVEALAAAGCAAQVGVELELYLYHGTPAELRARRFADLGPTTLQPADYSMLAADLFEELFGGVCAALGASGIEVESTQGEWGLGQWELSLRHADPVTAADNAALCKLAVRELAARAGLTATFMARPHADQPGSSGHLHLSLTDRSGAALFFEAGDPLGMSDACREALGGMLDHVADVAVLYAPNVNSYRRVHAQDFAGWGRSWGIDNRTTSFRVLGHGADGRRIEARLPGADANPYLAIAALLACARAGMAQAADPGPPVAGNAYEQPRSGLPRHLGEAAEVFAASTFARTAFGDDVVDHHAAAARAEWDRFLAAVTDWELLRYLDLA